MQIFGGSTDASVEAAISQILHSSVVLQSSGVDPVRMLGVRIEALMRSMLDSIVVDTSLLDEG